MQTRYQIAVRLAPMPLAGRELLFPGNSLACEWATTIFRHCTHSSAFLPSFGFRINVWFPVKISKALGIFLEPLETFTDLIWFTSIDSPPLWKTKSLFNIYWLNFPKLKNIEWFPIWMFSLDNWNVSLQFMFW